MSLNINGRLDFWGGRESLLEHWSVKGFVDMALIQEHFKREGSPLYELFGPASWNFFYPCGWGIEGSKKWWLCYFGQPFLATCQIFQYQNGSIFGVFTSGFLLTVYFPTKSPKQQMDQYREMFSIFVNDLLYFVHSSISNHAAEWIACGAKLNAHFRGVWFTSLKKG